jgi:hypothetical protein
MSIQVGITMFGDPEQSHDFPVRFFLPLKIG